MIKILDWDSNFFKLKVGSTDKIFDIKKANNFDLIYCFSAPEDNQLNNFYTQIGGKLVDKKVVYTKKCSEKHIILPESIIEIYSENDNPTLNSLATQSGNHSRFKHDSLLPNNSYERLYHIWLKKSLSREIAHHVYSYRVNNEDAGFITLNIKNDIIDIGLIAVNEKFRGKGIGKKLMLCAEYIGQQNEIKQIKVATQKDNISACKFYEALKFKETNTVNIYHYWTVKQ